MNWKPQVPGKLFPVLAAAGVLAVIGTLMNSPESRAQGAGGPTVTIDPSQLPLHVTGTTTLSGPVFAIQQGTWNVGAMQQGPWNVGAIANDLTTTLFSDTVDVPSGGEVTVGPFDVSHAKSVRVTVTLTFSCGCGNTTVDVDSMPLFSPFDTFVVNNTFPPTSAGGFFTSRVYDTPGTSLQVRLYNLPNVHNAMNVSVFARSN